MPQSSQIVPEYTVPHVLTVINDNTQVQETVEETVSELRSAFVFTSGKGRDRKVLDKATWTSYINEFGNPNMQRYGQAGYMPYNFLRTGLAKAWCMRITADNAAFANAIVVAKVKIGTSKAATPVPQMSIYHEIQTFNNISSEGELAALAESLLDTDPDVNGYASYPLFAIYSAGRGVYGNNTRFRVVPAVEADNENDFKNYRFEIYELEGSLRRRELFEVALHFDAAGSATTYFAEDIINDVETGSTTIGIATIQESLAAIFNLYKESVDPETELTEIIFDPVFGRTKSNSPIPGVVIDYDATDAVALDNIAALPLTGGSDGDFGLDVDPAVREQAINDAYIRAFNGEYDAAITSKRRTPSQVLFDANYPAEVKTAFAGLAFKRYDGMAFTDAGILNTISDAIAWGQANRGLYADRIFSAQMQHYKTRDPFTNKVITVTITYLLASLIPVHYSGVGNHVAMTGETYAALTGHIKNSLLPNVDADDIENKDALYKLCLNFFQTIKENVFVQGTQSTGQHITSDLSEYNNMAVLLDMKRDLENLSSSLAYNFAEPEDRALFTERADRIISLNYGNRVREYSVRFDMNEWEEQRNILHCYLEVIFRTMGKRAILEIDVNRRA